MKRQFLALGLAAVLGLVGIVLLISYANRADDRAFEGTEMVTVLRATEETAAKTPASEIGGSVEEVEIPKAAVVPGAIASLDGLDGLVTKSVLVPGDQLTEAKFASPDDVKGDTALPKGMQELTIPVSGARLVGGAVQAGDRVGFFSSYDGSTANPINNLLVLKVDNTTGAAGDTGGTLVTVAVKTLDAEKVIHTLEFGKVWLTKQNTDTDTRGGKTITSKDLAP